jgi:N-acetylmuramoyl-L-alanine amidase
MIRLAIACAAAAVVAACGCADRATVSPAATDTPSRAVAASTPPPRPRIVSWPLPYGAKRRAQMAAYAKRHYGVSTSALEKPHVIVEHYTATTTARSAYNTFASNARDPELHELPGTCAHFLVDRDGTIYQLVKTSLMCRHTVGLNYTAIGIENVGTSDASVMGNRRQRTASVQLARWLRCLKGVAVKDVIGHNESLSSPYHRERVARLRTQTHGDMRRATMRRYRELVARRAC